MKYFMLFIITFTIYAQEQEFSVDSGVGLSPRGGTVGIGANARIPFNIFHARLGRVVFGHQEGKSYLEYDVEINTAALWYAAFPLSFDVNTSNKFYKKQHNFLIGFGVPSFGDGDNRYGGGIYGGAQIISTEQFQSDKVILTNIIVQKPGTIIETDQLDAKIEDLVVANKDLFEEKKYQVNYKDFIGKTLGGDSLKFYFNFFTDEFSLETKLDIGIYNESRELIKTEFDVHDEVKKIDFFTVKEVKKFSNIRIGTENARVKYFRFNPGVKLGKIINKKLRVWLDAEYNENSLSIKSAEFKEKFYNRQGYIGAGLGYSFGK